MTAIPPVPPGIREIDPQAEADRLAAERHALPAAVIADEIFFAVHDGKRIAVRVAVTAECFLPVPADLGRKLADVIRENLPQ